MSAALKPAGPAPTMITSYASTRMKPRSLRAGSVTTHAASARVGSCQGDQAGIVPQRFQIDVDARARRRELWQNARDARQRIERAIRLAAQRVQRTDVVAGERI